MRRIAVFAMLVMASLAVSAVLAHEGHEHKMMGTVVLIDTRHIEMSTKDNEKATVFLDAQTKFMRGESPAAAADVKVGDRVVIAVAMIEGKMMARQVLLAASK